MSTTPSTLRIPLAAPRRRTRPLRGLADRLGLWWTGLWSPGDADRLEQAVTDRRTEHARLTMGTLGGGH